MFSLTGFCERLTHSMNTSMRIKTCLVIVLTVYPQYVGIKKPLDGFSHYINIGVRMRERFYVKAIFGRWCVTLTD